MWVWFLFFFVLGFHDVLMFQICASSRNHFRVHSVLLCEEFFWLWIVFWGLISVQGTFSFLLNSSSVEFVKVGSCIVGSSTFEISFVVILDVDDGVIWVSFDAAAVDFSVATPILLLVLHLFVTLLLRITRSLKFTCILKTIDLKYVLFKQI